MDLPRPFTKIVSINSQLVSGTDLCRSSHNGTIQKRWDLVNLRLSFFLCHVFLSPCGSKGSLRLTLEGKEGCLLPVP